MKNTFLFLFILCVITLSMGTALAQTVGTASRTAPFRTAQEAFTRAGIDLKADAKPADQALRQGYSLQAARDGKASIEPAPLSVEAQRVNSPGEVPLFQQWTDADTFVDTDQEVHVSYTANLDWDGPVWSYSILLTPGIETGAYDGTKSPDYFIPDVGDTGYIQGGTLYEGKTFRNAATIKFTKSMPSGQYYLSTTFFDQNGVLIQQISSYIYYQVSSVFGRYVWYIDEARSIVGKNNRRYLYLTGSFPMYSVMYAKVGTARSSDNTYSVFSTDGRNVFIPIDVFYSYASRDHSIGLSLWDPEFREVMNKANAVVIKRTTN
jgi:hypothetical protein